MQMLLHVGDRMIFDRLVGPIDATALAAMLLLQWEQAAHGQRQSRE
jgi:hypothetical protein